MIAMASNPGTILCRKGKGAFFSRYAGLLAPSRKKSVFAKSGSLSDDQPTILVAESDGLMLVLPHKNLKTFQEKVPSCVNSL